MKSGEKLAFFVPEDKSKIEITFSSSPVHAGFPSPAEDFAEARLDLNKALIKNPSSTFYARVKGESMIGDGIDDGDILVIDKSLNPKNNCLAVCFLDGEFTIKRVNIKKDIIYLLPSNSKFKPIEVTKENQFMIWGIVSYIIKRVL